MALTPVDVYDAASAIGIECQSIISEHGPDVLLNLMPKVISMLEELEACALYREKEEEEVVRLREVVEALRIDCQMQTELKEKLNKSLEQLERSWYSDTQRLLDQITELEAENNRLAQQLASDVCPTAPSTKEMPSVRTIVMDTAAGHNVAITRPGPQITKPSNLLEEDISASVIFETDERLQLSAPESLAADLQLIGRLKECIANNFRAIHGLNRDMLYTTLALDAAEEEVCRLARQSGQLRVHKLPYHTLHLDELSSQLDSVKQQLSIKERGVSKLHELLKTSEETLSQPTGKGTGTRSDSRNLLSPEFQGTPFIGPTLPPKATDEPDTHELVTLEELRQLICERNELRCRLIEIEEQMAIAEEEGRRTPELQGPLPREPIDKLRPGWSEKPTIQSMFQKLLARLTESSTE